MCKGHRRGEEKIIFRLLVLNKVIRKQVCDDLSVCVLNIEFVSDKIKTGKFFCNALSRQEF